MIELSQDYLTDQLIPYIGNKRKLLGLIGLAIHETGVTSGTFLDAFAGSGVVSRLAKVMGFRVVCNDWEPYAETLNRAYIAANGPPCYDALGGIQDAFGLLNSLAGERGYIASHYCPEDDECYDVSRERMFYTQANGRRIDAMREQIADWASSGAIDREEEAVLLAPLIFQAAYCSNTSGVFKGFHNGWGGATKTAWYRIRSLLTLRQPVFFDNGLSNEVRRTDALEAAEDVECDIAYLDPPYNQHQYGANYHLLNTVAMWDKPPISRHISVDGARDKAAIRRDWRSSRRSPYCYRATALPAFRELLGRLRSRWILVSYSTDGIIPVEDMLSSLAENGSLRVLTRRYKRYRVSSQRPSSRPSTVEFVAIVSASASGNPCQVERAMEDIARQRSEGQVCQVAAS